MDRFENHVLLDFAFTNTNTNPAFGKVISFQDILINPNVICHVFNVMFVVLSFKSKARESKF